MEIDKLPFDPSTTPVGSSSPILKWQILPVLVAAGLAACFYSLASDPELWAILSHWTAYLGWPVFGDLGITLTHFHQADAGIDPLSDPTSEFAYPRAVLALRHLGIHHLPLPWLGAFQAVAAMSGIVLVLRPKAFKRSIATAMLFLTPPIMLGLERGNLDFVLFLICVLSALSWSKARSPQGLVYPIIGVSVAALMKLYPIFAIMGAALAEHGKRRLMWLASIVVVLGYWALNQDEIGLIAQKIPVTSSASWGCLVLFVRLDRFLSADPHSYVWLANVRWPLIALLTYVASALIACRIGSRLRARLLTATWEPREWCYYWLGAAICCGSFAGSNFAYRWIFVILTLPLLIRFMYNPDRYIALWARVSVGSLIVSFLAPLSADRWVFLFSQVANWTCILCLIVGGAALRSVNNHPTRVRA